MEEIKKEGQAELQGGSMGTMKILDEIAEAASREGLTVHTNAKAVGIDAKGRHYVVPADEAVPGEEVDLQDGRRDGSPEGREMG